jgi:hypothetical protein
MLKANFMQFSNFKGQKNTIGKQKIEVIISNLQTTTAQI